MNRLFFILTFYLFLSGWIFSDELNNYPIEKVNDISAGKEEGMIGWELAVAGGFSGPTSFAINNKYIYVPDRVNYRVNVYNFDFMFIKIIYEEEEKQNAHFALNLKTDDYGNLYYSFSDLGLIKTNNQGKQVFMVDHLELPGQVKWYDNFFPINDYVFFYNDQNEVQYINNFGKIESTDKAVAKLLEIQNGNTANNLVKEIKIPDEKKQIFVTLRNSKKYLLVGDNFYSTDFRKNREYFDLIKEIREFVISEKQKNDGNGEKKKININLDDYNYTLFGYDEEHNGYWGAGKQEGKDKRRLGIIILSKYGEILDGFYFGQLLKNKPDLESYPVSGAQIAIAPSGDVYFLVGSKEKYTLYKVERRW